MQEVIFVMHVIYVALQLIKINAGHQHSSAGLLSDYCDGKAFKHHSLFKDNSNSLQIIFYFDEVELCNPLGSYRKKHKIGIWDLYKQTP